MNMEQKVIIVLVAVIAVVAVAGAAVFLMGGNNDSGEKYSINGALNVYGNADGDYKIDQKDLDIINDIINGKKDAKDYKFADADQKNGVTQDDAELVKKIINKEPCTVYIVNQKKTAGEYTSSVKWPIKSAIATASSNNLLLFELSGLTDQIKGITFTSSSDPAIEKTLFAYYADRDKVAKLGTSSTAIDIDAAMDTIKSKNVTAVITDYTDSTLSNEAQFNANGIDVIRISSAVTDPDRYSSQLLMMAFLFDTNNEKIYEFAEYNTKILNEIKEKLKSVDSKRKVITCNGAGSVDKATGIPRMWVSAGSSDYRDVVEAAGGVYGIDEDLLGRISTYTSGAYFNEGDTWVYEINPSAIISIRAGGWYEGSVDTVKMFEESLSIFNKTGAWENGGVAVIAGDAPITVRIAYAACMLYPEIFDLDWANEINQNIMDKFYPEKLNLEGKPFCITKEVYEAAKKAAA